MDRPTLAGILRTHGSTYRRSHALSPTQARAWRAIVDCRTAALGGVRERCANCGAERHVWRSCRNRHCPQCQTRAKEAWRAARLREVLLEAAQDPAASEALSVFFRTTRFLPVDPASQQALDDLRRGVTRVREQLE